MTRIIEVWINCPDQQVAQRIAETLVDERLAACANLYPEIRSFYHWKGAVAKEPEVPLLVKARREHFEKLSYRVAQLHPYEVPSIVAVPVAMVNAAYEEWVLAETEAGGVEKGEDTPPHQG